jgi:hypothetical protein
MQIKNKKLDSAWWYTSVIPPIGGKASMDKVSEGFRAWLK